MEVSLSQCEHEVMGEHGRLAWAVQRAGQLVREVGIRVRFRQAEKKLRLALKERIREQQMVKEKVKRVKIHIANHRYMV